MKTTIEIPEPLLAEARKLAAKKGVTLEAIVARGLRLVIAESARAAPFRLKRASFKGRGLHPDAGDGSWERLRELVYEGRGGFPRLDE